MSKSTNIIDFAIVGAGPAGLAAAITASAAGLRVILIDDQIEPGGQIWRSAGSASAGRAQQIGEEYIQGQMRVKHFLTCGAEYFSEHTVWHIETDTNEVKLHCAGPNGGRLIRAKRLLLATGALERPVPMPGWNLPGVMTAGGLQILLKSAGLTHDDAVLTGAGPLLWLLGAQMVAAGTPPKAMVECVSAKTHIVASRHLFSALRNIKPLLKGLSLIANVQRAGVPVYRGASNLRIEGDTRARALQFLDWRGREKRIETEMIGLHCGVIPNQQASRLLRLPHQWNKQQHAFLPDRDDHLQVGKDQYNGLYLAGDGARIGGAEVAWLEGCLVGKIVAGQDTTMIRTQLARSSAGRRFIDRLYLPDLHLRRPNDETMLCRCEAVTAGRVRQAVRDGAMGPNQVKFLLRPGMGPCQGRVCGLAVSEVVAESLGQEMQEVGYFRIRPPLKPIPLGIIAEELDEHSNS